MARSRNIKPGFFTNDVLSELPALTRLLFAGLWVIADRAGRLEDRPKKIKAEVLPYDEGDPEAMLNALQAHGFIRRYRVRGQALIQVLAWDKHQNPHVKEAASTLPAMDEADAPTVAAPDEHGASMVQEPGEASPLPERAGLISDSLNLIPDSLNSPPERGAPRKRDAAPARPDDVSEPVWSDWVRLRAKKRATVSATVLEEARAEAAKAGVTFERFLRIWCMRGSQGLQAEWLRADERGTGQTPSEPQWRAEQRQRTRQAAPGVAVGGPASQFFIDAQTRDVPDLPLIGSES